MIWRECPSGKGEKREEEEGERENSSPSSGMTAIAEMSPKVSMPSEIE